VGGLTLSVGFTIFLTPLLFYLAENKEIKLITLFKIIFPYNKKKVLV
jgi:hypothetical protein